jgi:hypothetical protein
MNDLKMSAWISIKIRESCWKLSACFESEPGCLVSLSREWAIAVISNRF